MTRIAKLRERLGWSQQRLAEELGIGQSWVSRLERGRPPRGAVVKLLDQLEASALIPDPSPDPSRAREEKGATPQAAE